MTDAANNSAPFHHYVPRFYLEGFVDPSLSQGDRPMHSVWLYRRNKRPRHVSIRKVGGEPGFYRHEAGDFEPQLMRRESEWAVLLAKLLKDKRLVGSDRLEFSRFIGAMGTRVPHFYDMTHAIASHLDEYIALRARDDKDAERIREQLTASNLLPPKLTKQWMLTEILETGTDYMHHVYDQMNWLVVETGGDDDYVVTSDTPVSLTDPHGPEFTTTGMRFSVDTEMTLPLDRKHVLFGTLKRREGSSGSGLSFPSDQSPHD